MAVALTQTSSCSSSSSFPKTRLKLSHSFSSRQFTPIRKRIESTRLRASSTVSSNSTEKNVGLSEKLDSWLQDSVAHIVKDLNGKQSPLLVQLYSEDGNVSVKSDTAYPEEWDGVKSEWDNGEVKRPDGLILVEELKQLDGGDDIVGEGLARAWGIVVQAKGSEFRPACYLLKTSRVCVMNLVCCTHFCLMRVNSFEHSALQQFQNSWLLN